MKTAGTIALFVIVICILIRSAGCSYSNVEEIKQHATNTWENSGFKVIGYEGYEIGMPWAPGGQVWYIVELKDGTNGVCFHGFVSKWGSEYHIYNLKAINAFPNK